MSAGGFVDDKVGKNLTELRNVKKEGSTDKRGKKMVVEVNMEADKFRKTSRHRNKEEK